MRADRRWQAGRNEAQPYRHNAWKTGHDTMPRHHQTCPEPTQNPIHQAVQLLAPTVAQFETHIESNLISKTCPKSMLD
jgi:hypothetical protein